MPITSTGIGSGLDINGLIGDLMALERRPVTLLDRREAGMQARLGAYGALKGALAAFRTGMEGLSDPSRLRAATVTVSDASVLAAAAAPGATPGSHTIEVRELAQAPRLVSATFVDATTVVGTGTVTIQFGVWQNGAFTVNPDRSPVDVVIDGTNQSLAGIRDAINAARAGVTATILNDGNGRRLVLSGDRTGAANGLRVLVDDAGDGNDVDAAGLSALAWDPAGSPGAGRNLAEVAAARDALLNVDGVNDIRRADNVLRDLVDGVVVTLLKEGAPGVPVSVTVARDPAGAQSAVRSFVAAANDLLKTLADLTAYDPVARRGAILQGDPTALGLMTQLRATLGAAVHPDPDRTLTLSGIGVGFRQDGTLALDEARLQQAMDADAEAVMALFAGGSGPGAEGLAVRLTRLAAHWLEGGGPVESRSDAVSAEIEALADRRAAIERRLEDVERRLRSQYTALDTLLGRLRSSSDFLAQQLDSLSALAAGRAGRR